MASTSAQLAHHKSKEKATMVQVFFNVLLPPIIFYAGFSVKKKHFFENFYAIALLGIIGTFISCVLLSAGGCRTYSVNIVSNPREGGLIMWVGVWWILSTTGL